MTASSRLSRYLAKQPHDQLDSAAVAYIAALDYLEKTAPEVAACIIKELKDQRSHAKLIASENFSSLAVQLAMGNLLTDKYAEGYPRHRFYAGCENVDAIEEMAQAELKSLFGCDHAYVQPHSGADANLVAFWSILVYRIQNPEVEKLGKKSVDELTEAEYEKIRQLMLSQKVLGMSLNSGGHLTHGYRHNVSSKMMQAFHYDVDRKTELIDYTALAKQAQDVRPTILLAGYSAHPRRINFAKMREIADASNAILMVDMAHFAGLVAGKVFQGDYDPCLSLISLHPPHTRLCAVLAEVLCFANRNMPRPSIRDVPWSSEARFRMSWLPRLWLSKKPTRLPSAHMLSGSSTMPVFWGTVSSSMDCASLPVILKTTWSFWIFRDFLLLDAMRKMS